MRNSIKSLINGLLRIFKQLSAIHYD